jgi:hypothetical protein
VHVAIDVGAGSVLNSWGIASTSQVVSEDYAAVVVPSNGFDKTLFLIYANGDNDLSEAMQNLHNTAERGLANNNNTNVIMLMLLDGPRANTQRQRCNRRCFLRTDGFDRNRLQV